MTYKPHRDARFEYVADVIEFIEYNQCITCTFRKDESETPMCFPIESGLITEQPVEELDDRGAHGVVCTKYRDADITAESHPDQNRLF